MLLLTTRFFRITVIHDMSAMALRRLISFSKAFIDCAQIAIHHNSNHITAILVKQCSKTSL